MLTLRETESGTMLVTISETDLEVLLHALEEESLAGRDSVEISRRRG